MWQWWDGGDDNGHGGEGAGNIEYGSCDDGGGGCGVKDGSGGGETVEDVMVLTMMPIVVDMILFIFIKTLILFCNVFFIFLLFWRLLLENRRNINLIST